MSDPALIGVTDATDGKYVKADNGCWLWTGTLKNDGYPLVRFKYRQWRAHRLHFAFYNGPLIDGLEVDHTCNNRRCVNPEHLEQVTPGENMRRGADRRAACRRGHPRSPSNLRWNGKTFACRECSRIRARERRAGNSQA